MIGIDRRGCRLDLVVEIDAGILRAQQFFEFADGGTFDRFARDRAAEDIVGLVFRVDRKLEIEAIVNVYVRKQTRFTMLDDLLAFDVVLRPRRRPANR